jgi:hypothetical protein
MNVLSLFLNEWSQRSTMDSCYCGWQYTIETINVFVRNSKNNRLRRDGWLRTITKSMTPEWEWKGHILESIHLGQSDRVGLFQGHFFSHETELCSHTALVIRHPGSDTPLNWEHGYEFLRTVKELLKALAPPRVKWCSTWSSPGFRMLCKRVAASSLTATLIFKRDEESGNLCVWSPWTEMAR